MPPVLALPPSNSNYTYLPSSILTDLPTILNETVINGGIELDPSVTNILQQSGVYTPSYDSSSFYTSDSVDYFTDLFYENGTLPEIEEANDTYFGSLFDDAWTSSNLDNAIPDSYDEIPVDQGFSGEGTGAGAGAGAGAGSDEYDDYDDLPDLDDGIPMATAETQEDVAPSDPISTTELMTGVFNDMSEEDRNLSGGISDNNHIGVRDAGMEGPPESHEESGETNIVSSSVDPVESSDSIPFDTSEVTAYGNSSQTPLEKSDFKGDIGLDTAVQAANLSSLDIDFENKVSPFLPTSNTSQQVNRPDGVSSNTDAANIQIQEAYAKLTNLTLYNEQRSNSITSIYSSLDNIQHEINSIDNIVYIKDVILTPAEKIQKADNRITRLVGVQKLLVDTILTAKDHYLLSGATALVVSASAIIVALKKWKDDLNNEQYLRTIETILSPSNNFVLMAIEKAMERHKHADARVVSNYSTVIQSYADSNSSERDASKILKYDYDFAPSHSKFTKKMKMLYNKEIQESLVLQRKTRNALKTHTSLSKFNTDKIVSKQQMKQNVKQSIATLHINTDNIKQMYPKIPFGVKTNSRRLNLLETPVATKQRKSVPYVNMYEQTKLRFS